MINGIYIPSHVTSENKDPNIPVAQKLQEIAEAEPTVAPLLAGKDLLVPINDNAFRTYFCNQFHQLVPYVKGVDFELSQRRRETHLDINWFDLGDKELYGHGIGTRLLRRTVEFGLEQSDNLTAMTMRPVNMGVLNTMAKVVGQENIAFRHETTWYGAGQEKPLEAIFVDRPYSEGSRYLMHEVRASIDSEIVQKLGEQAVEGERTE